MRLKEGVYRIAFRFPKPGMETAYLEFKKVDTENGMAEDHRLVYEVKGGHLIVYTCSYHY